MPPSLEKTQAAVKRGMASENGPILPLRFQSKAEADAWLQTTGHYGLVHRALHDYVIVRFEMGGTWAYATPTLLVSLPHW